MLMLLLAHWNGCIQFLIPVLQDIPHNSWIAINRLEVNARPYLTWLHITAPVLVWASDRSVTQPGCFQTTLVVHMIIILCMVLYIQDTSSVLYYVFHAVCCYVPLQNATVGEQYSWSLFKAISHMLCIGFGRWPPQNITETWLTIVSMMVGATFYALFIGNMSTLLLSIDSSGRLYNEKVNCECLL